MSWRRAAAGAAVLYPGLVFGGWLAGGPRVVIFFTVPAVLMAAAAAWKWRRDRRHRGGWTAQEQAFLDGLGPMPEKRQAGGRR